MIQKVFIRNVSWRFYAKSKFCVYFEVHIPVQRHLSLIRNRFISKAIVLEKFVRNIAVALNDDL